MVRRSALAIAVALFVCVPVGTSKTEAAGTIPVYLFAGQSNMVGTATHAADLAVHAPSLYFPSDKILFWGPTTDAPRVWAPIEPPTEVTQAMFRAGFGPELSAARALSKRHPKWKIGILKYARNATNLYSKWNPSNSRGYYRRMIDSTRYALYKLREQTKLEPKIVGFFWMQGESDSNTRKNAEAYGENLTRFIATLRRDLRSPHLPVLIGQIPDVRWIYPKLLPYSHIVRAEQMKVALADPHAYLVSTAKLERAPLSRIHFSSKGTLQLGYRFVRKDAPL